MLATLKDKALATKERLIAQGRDQIRERAIEQTKKRLALKGRSSAEFTQEELEAIVAEEESKLIEKLKKGSLVALLVFFGIQ